MTPEDRQPANGADDANESDLSAHFPVLPVAPEAPKVPMLDSAPQPVKDVTIKSGQEVPEVPRLEPVVRPTKPKAGGSSIEVGSYRKAAIASTAATSFIMPTLVLSLGGYWLDQKLHHTTNYLAFVGVVLGLIVGTSALMRIISKLND